jgi:hypothetical protein
VSAKFCEECGALQAAPVTGSRWPGEDALPATTASGIESRLFANPLSSTTAENHLNRSEGGSVAERSSKQKKLRIFSGIAAVVIVSACVGVWYLRATERSSNDRKSSDADSEYHESNETMTPYALSKNPYKWMGHSGILDTGVLVMRGNGLEVAHYPGIALQFEKMIDEHSAIYSVMTATDNTTIPDGEIAVILPDSEPPDPGRLWRVFIEGPREAVNDYGATLQIVAVRFEGYYYPPQ